MANPDTHTDTSLIDRLTSGGFWAARAASRLAQGKFSEVVRICQENLGNSPDLVSGRLVYATALHLSGQAELAAEEFHHVLTLDPENLVALKFLGDIMFASGDGAAAMANYRRILEIDPLCRGLRSHVKKPRPTTTRTITLSRGSETRSEKQPQHLRDIPFFTETMGDLYLTQGD